MKPEKKTEQILIRVTPSEKKQITENAAAAHMSISAYLARVAEEKKVVALDNLPQLIYQVMNIGVNINQIAYIGNSQRILYKEQLLAVVNQMEEVKKILRKILAAIYDEKECSIRTLEKKIEKLIESVSVNGNG